MTKKESIGKLHSVPADVRKALDASPAAVRVGWEDITPLARNEWICWIISVKQKETRDDHIRKMCEMLIMGKRRPCCWAGCKHRK